MKTYKLMIKEHNKTKLKYLCMTVKSNWQKYTGSGAKWKNHLRKHGNDFNTELLFESADYEDFVKVCVFYSNVYSVVEDEQFANAIPETGYDNGTNVCNFVVYWDMIDENVKRDIYKRRRDSLVSDGNHWAHTKDTNHIVGNLISNGLKSRWGSLSEEEKTAFSETHGVIYSLFTDEQKEIYLKNLEHARMFSKKFFENKDSEEYRQFVILKAQQTQEYFTNMTEDERVEHGKKVSEGRLSMSEESKTLRAIRVAESFKTSEKRKAFNEDMKVSRTGIDNPNAKIVIWFGQKMTKQDFLGLNIDKFYADEMFAVREDCVPADDTVKIYDTIYCPHCNKNTGSSKHSAFKRWHFDNCKHKTV